MWPDWKFQIEEHSVVLGCLEPLLAEELETNSVTLIGLTTDTLKVSAGTSNAYHSGHRLVGRCTAHRSEHC